jgi:hypothetical protein
MKLQDKYSPYSINIIRKMGKEKPHPSFPAILLLAKESIYVLL